MDNHLSSGKRYPPFEHLVGLGDYRVTYLRQSSIIFRCSWTEILYSCSETIASCCRNRLLWVRRKSPTSVSRRRRVDSWLEIRFDNLDTNVNVVERQNIRITRIQEDPKLSKHSNVNTESCLWDSLRYMFKAYKVPHSLQSIISVSGVQPVRNGSCPLVSLLSTVRLFSGQKRCFF